MCNQPYFRTRPEAHVRGLVRHMLGQSHAIMPHFAGELRQEESGIFWPIYDPCHKDEHTCRPLKAGAMADPQPSRPSGEQSRPFSGHFVSLRANISL